MIPKIIHYCWLSNDPIPESFQKYMDTWSKYLPEYEFIHWKFDRFPKHRCQWVREAFDSKKYAFAADYIRLYALYHYGGIYLDMDVEVKKSFNPFLHLRTMMCWQNQIGGLEVAAFGAEKGSQWVKDCLTYYGNRSFIKRNGSFDTKTLPSIVEDVLREKGYKLTDCRTIGEAKAVGHNDIPVLTCDYFSPKSYKTGVLEISDNTYSIHHFAGSWIEKPWIEKQEERMWSALGIKSLNIYNKVKFLPANIIGLFSKYHKNTK